MGFFKRYFCTHEYSIIRKVKLLSRHGTMIVFLTCKKCGDYMDTFHDLTETERVEFRSPYVEELLFKQGYIEEKKGKILIKRGNKSELEDGASEYGVVINDYGLNDNAFDDVVSMFCNEVQDKLGIKITPGDFITKSKLKGGSFRKFVFPLPNDTSNEFNLLFDTAKKNVQLKIKGDKKYKDIELMGYRRIGINYSDIPQLWRIIEEDVQLKKQEPLFLNLQIRFYTSIFDYDRFVTFAKKLDKHLDLDELDYADVEKRIKDAVGEVIEDMHKKISKRGELTKKRAKEVIFELAKQGAIKLIYMRNFTWDTANLKKKSKDYLNKLSGLSGFMQRTLRSKGSHQDFLLSLFKLSTDLDHVSAYGCFATINDKAGIDESIISLELSDKTKEV